MRRYSDAVNGYTALNRTKLDTLDDFDEIGIATAYRIDCKELDSFPADLEILGRLEFAYAILSGWKTTPRRKLRRICRTGYWYPNQVDRKCPERDHMIEWFQ